MGWRPTFALPNLMLSEPVESAFIALVPHTDPRARRLSSQYPAYRKFATSFTDAFGEKLQPPVLLLSEDAPASVQSAEAVAGIRDLLCAATIPLARARWMTSGVSVGGAHYSETFDFYPWSLGKDNLHLASQTPAQLASHDVAKFRGQSDPHLGVTIVLDTDLDEPLLEALLLRWSSRFTVARPTRVDVSLFRSLGTATQAMRLAGGVEAQLYDFGRVAGNWTSAFETLLHQGTTGASMNERQVRDVIGAMVWDRRDLRHSRYVMRAGDIVIRSRGKPVRGSLPQLIYFQLAAARNAFLHGEDVTLKSLFLQPRGQALGNLAAALYRAMLASQLGLVWNEPMPPLDDSESWGQWYGRRNTLKFPQGLIEDAIAIARVSREDLAKQRREILRNRVRSRRRVRQPR